MRKNFGKFHDWINAVHTVPLASVTPDKIREWKKRFIDSVGKNEIKRRSRKVSCNSMLRQDRSLFSRRNVLGKLSLELPTPLPFDGVNVEKRTDTKFYGCGVDPRGLLRDAAAELGPDRLPVGPGARAQASRNGYARMAKFRFRGWHHPNSADKMVQA